VLAAPVAANVRWHVSDDKARLSEIAQKLGSLCSHVSVREEDSLPYLFAVGLKRVHSLDLRRITGSLILELWRGPDGKDDVVSKEKHASFEEAFGRCEQWLRNDAT
jgi:hypothetical protein